MICFDNGDVTAVSYDTTSSNVTSRRNICCTKYWNIHRYLARSTSAISCGVTWTISVILCNTGTSAKRNVVRLLNLLARILPGDSLRQQATNRGILLRTQAKDRYSGQIASDVSQRTQRASEPRQAGDSNSPFPKFSLMFFFPSRTLPMKISCAEESRSVAIREGPAVGWEIPRILEIDCPRESWPLLREPFDVLPAPPRGLRHHLALQSNQSIG